MAQDSVTIRILSLLSLLHRDTYWSVERLAKRFDTSPRTIYRYLEDLEQMKYHVVKDPENRYRIEPRGNTLLPEFEPDEYIFLREAVASVRGSHPVRQSLLAKINENLNAPAIGLLVDHQLHYNMLDTIISAMQTGNCIKLKDYHSLSSNEIKDRIVEPLRLIRGMRYLLAFDIAAGEIRQFKLDRIHGTEKMNKKVTAGNRFEHWGTDDFYMNGSELVQVKIGLSNRAAFLLVEEYGVRKSVLIQQDDPKFPWLYVHHVYGFEGVGRFVMGLIDQVHVYSPMKLKTYIKKKITSVYGH